MANIIFGHCGIISIWLTPFTQVRPFSPPKTSNASPPPAAPLARAESSSSLSSNASLSAGNTPTVGKNASSSSAFLGLFILLFFSSSPNCHMPLYLHHSVPPSHFPHSPPFLHSSPYRSWAHLCSPPLLSRARAALPLFFLSAKPKWVLPFQTLLFPWDTPFHVWCLQLSSLLCIHFADAKNVIIRAC